MPRENIYTEDPTIKKKNAQSKQGVPASLHQDMEAAPPLPPRNMKPAPPSPVPPSPFRSSVLRNMKPAQTLSPRAFEQIKDSTMGGSKPPVPSPRSTPNMDRPPALPPRAER
ncbi:hypothetical protein [Enterococcus hirae]|uniref:hypothetical protein n=1 Tax=Enterococcus hirae TaxID=1354 RepID=UPI001A95C7B2|nr:hypothetical protein [Enterococcus hirae]MBO1102824.1 hypothetical protein [Enterococcus hirae]